MLRFEKSIEVDAPVEQVFAYLLDPAHLPEYMTGGGVVKDIQRLPDGRYAYTEVSKFLGIHSETKCEQVEVIPNERIVERDQGDGMDGTMTLRFERLPEGRTRVSVYDETSLHGGPFAKFGEAFFAKYFNHGMEMAMEAAKAHLEASSPTTVSR